MPILTPAEITRIRSSLGNYESSFTDAQIQTYYDISYDLGAGYPINGAVAQAFYNLAMGAVSYTNYRQGETTENEGIIYDRLWALYDRWYNLSGMPSPLPTFSMHPLRLFYVDLPCDPDPLTDCL